ncbi:hypothetical protein [Clostridium sp. HBUAS56017]|uniref:hypothetical protein n=1 Tax=Clostridium sp. HBUAS56017 TaxID=2571128 RepID=UPI001177757C|nr:hypothetical protein [Clostridium sp. HBUAS56017]
MKIMNLKINNKLVYIFAFLIILTLLILLFINLSPGSRDMNNLNKICKDIEKHNSSLQGCLTDNGLDLNETEDILSSELINLKSINDELYALEVNDNKLSIKDELLKTLGYNITLFESCLNLVKAPEDKNLLSKYNDYSTTYSLFEKNYETLNSLGVNGSIPPEAKNFFSRSFDYFGTIIKINRDNDIYVDQKKSYVSNIKNCLIAFDSINEDLKPALTKIKEDKRSLDVLLKDIKDKRSKLSDIKSKSYGLTIPEGGNNCYNLLQESINYYELYINALEDSIIFEKTSKDANSAEIEKNYNDSFFKYNDFINKLKYLSAELDNFNKK